MHCRMALPLVEQACAEEGALLDRKNFIMSLLYALITFRRTPVIFVNGRLMSQGRVPSFDELRHWLRDARASLDAGLRL